MLRVSEKKKWLLGSGLAVLVVGIFVFSWKHFSTTDVEKGNVNLDEIELESFPRAISFNARSPKILIDGVDVMGLTRDERAAVIDSALESMGEQLLTANHQDQRVEATLANLGIQLESDLETVLDDLERLENELERKSTFELRLPYIYSLNLTYCDEMLGWWTRSVARQLNVAPVEPSLRKTSRGNFTATEGSAGRRVMMNQLKNDVAAVFQNVTQPNLSVDVSMETVEPTRDTSMFGTVDTMIARAESPFSRAESGRASNVDRGAQLVSGTLLMPGEKFSFNELVYPVNSANGFGYGTIFMQGRVSQGIGGGLCQVSSTIYWAQLRTGIPTTYRRAHSRPVFYVPRGLDATMFIGPTNYAATLRDRAIGLDANRSIGQIDYTFKNTLDYPLYLNAFTQGGTLVIEFWSNSEALNGLRFEPRTTRVATTAGTKSYDTFLRTYNAAGQLISEEFVHRSTYITN